MSLPFCQLMEYAAGQENDMHVLVNVLKGFVAPRCERSMAGKVCKLLTELF